MKRLFLLLFGAMSIGFSVGAAARVDVILTVPLPMPPVYYPSQPPVVYPQQQCNLVYPNNGMPPYQVCSHLPPVVYYPPPPVIYYPPPVYYPRSYPVMVPAGPAIIFRNDRGGQHRDGHHNRGHHR